LQRASARCFFVRLVNAAGPALYSLVCTQHHHHTMTTSTTRRIYVACLASYNNGVLHGQWIETEDLDADDLFKEVQDKVLLTSHYPNVMVTCPDCEGDNTLEEQLDNAAETAGFDIHMQRDNSWVVEKGIGSMNYVGPTRIDALKAFQAGENISVELCERCKGTGKLPSSEEYAIHDHEGFPRGLVGEYTPLSEIADLEEKLGELNDDDEIEAFMIYVNDLKSGDIKDVTVAQFREAYRGKWDSTKDFAEDWAVETGLIDDQHPMFSYIDWEHYWNGDLRHNGFYEENGHFFLDQ
jgi:antirestriction protein